MARRGGGRGRRVRGSVHAAEAAAGRARRGGDGRTCARSRGSASATGRRARPGPPATSESVDYVAGRLRAAGYRVRLQDVPFPIFRERSAAAARGRRPAHPGQVAELLAAGARPGARSPAPAAAAARATSTACAAGSRSSSAGCARSASRRGSPRRRAPAGWWWATAGASRAPSGSLGRPGIRIPAVATGAAGLALRGQALMVVDTVAETRRTRNVIAERPGPSARPGGDARRAPRLRARGPGHQRQRQRGGRRRWRWPSSCATAAACASASGAPRSSASTARAATSTRSAPPSGAGSRATSTSTWSARPIPCATSTARARCARRSSRRCGARRLAFDEIDDRRLVRPRAVRGRRDRRRRRLLGLGGAQERAPGPGLRRPRRPPARPLLPPPLRHARPRRREGPRGAGRRRRAGARRDSRVARVRGDAAAAEGHAGAPAPRRPGRRGLPRARWRAW